MEDRRGARGPHPLLGPTATSCFTATSTTCPQPSFEQSFCAVDLPVKFWLEPNSQSRHQTNATPCGDAGFGDPLHRVARPAVFAEVLTAGRGALEGCQSHGGRGLAT